MQLCSNQLVKVFFIMFPTFYVRETDIFDHYNSKSFKNASVVAVLRHMPIKGKRSLKAQDRCRGFSTDQTRIHGNLR